MLTHNAMPNIFLERLCATSNSFKKKKTRHFLKSAGLIYCAFSIGGFYIPRELAQRDARMRIIKFDLPEEVLKNASVLDLGCNNGAMLFELTNHDITQGLGIEFDKDKVELAKDIVTLSDVQGLMFKQADIDTVKAEELGCFDVVLALAIEAHVNNRAHLFDLLGKATAKVLCFEGNSKCDVDETCESLYKVGFKHIDFKGFCNDDVLESNNNRPIFIAWK